MFNIHDNILTKKSFFSVFEETLVSNNLDGPTTKVISSNDISFARYDCNKNRIFCNYDNIVTTIKKSLNSSLIFEQYEANELVNLYLLQIIHHEIVHVLQKYKNEDLIMHAEMWEEELKRAKMYDINRYLNNPLERQANIISIVTLMQRYDFSKLNNAILLNRLKSYMLFGYDDKFPIYKYFENSKYLNAVSELTSKISDMDKKIEYGCNLSDKEYKLMKGRCL